MTLTYRTLTILQWLTYSWPDLLAFSVYWMNSARGSMLVTNLTMPHGDCAYSHIVICNTYIFNLKCMAGKLRGRKRISNSAFSRPPKLYFWNFVGGGTSALREQLMLSTATYVHIHTYIQYKFNLVLISLGCRVLRRHLFRGPERASTSTSALLLTVATPWNSPSATTLETLVQTLIMRGCYT